jgi:hypothetical protein
MGQLSLFNPRSPYPDGLPGHRGGTSREAAEVVAITLRERQQRVLDFLRERGDRGATVDEILEALGEWNVNRIAPRVTEMAKLGRIEKTGERRRTRSGCMADAWRAR